jgi:asparagine synthase (glutamine-hydrolysing)
MCGIAGILDLTGRREVPAGVARRMSSALIHRGPDEDGFYEKSGIALVSRRLSIVGLEDGQQPVTNEDNSAYVVFNGELFDHIEQRATLAARGHRLKKSCDTEIIPHLWEDHGEGVFEKLRGQFAVALWDVKRSRLLLGRDRFGIAPLYWTKQGDWFLFASEIKSLLASGMVPAEPDLKGIDHVFSFSALPGPTTCFKGVQLLPAGHFLEIVPESVSHGNPAIREKAYWTMDFPDEGDEVDAKDPRELIDEFEEIMLGAVERRLRADVPVGSYLSGGIDSSIIVALARHIRGRPLATYTVRIDAPDLDELDGANEVAKHVGTDPPIVQNFGPGEALESYPRLIHAAEAPVIDTSCAALLRLAGKVHSCGQKVVLTGEGADEWLIGYPWYKVAKILGAFDSIPGLNMSNPLRRTFLRLQNVPQFSNERRRKMEDAVGGPNAWLDAYGVLGISKLRFYADPLLEVFDQTDPWADLGMPLERAGKWHPLNRGVWMAARVTLAGHLLQAKGDRVAMHSSVEVRYPFLDEEVFDFTAKLVGRALVATFRSQSAKGYLPCTIKHLPYRERASVRAGFTERRVASTHWLFRRQTGATLAAAIPQDASGLAPPTLG